MRNFLHWFFHKWGRWEDVEDVKGCVAQIRTCQICNKKESRRI